MARTRRVVEARGAYQAPAADAFGVSNVVAELGEEQPGRVFEAQRLAPPWFLMVAGKLDERSRWESGE
jgi:hypothetical protein